MSEIQPHQPGNTSFCPEQLSIYPPKVPHFSDVIRPLFFATHGEQHQPGNKTSYDCSSTSKGDSPKPATSGVSQTNCHRELFTTCTISWASLRPEIEGIQAGSGAGVGVEAVAGVGVGLEAGAEVKAGI